VLSDYTFLPLISYTHKRRWQTLKSCRSIDTSFNASNTTTIKYYNKTPHKWKHILHIYSYRANTHTRVRVLYIHFMAQQPLMGQVFNIIEDSRSHSDTPHSAGLLWTSNRRIAETSTWQCTTLTRKRHPQPSRIRNRNPSKRAAAEPRLRPRGHWGRHTFT